MNIKTETIHNITRSLASELNNGRPSVRSVVIAALALWFGLVFFLGAQGAFVTNPGSPPLPIFLGLAIPLSLFLAAYFGWTADFPRFGNSPVAVSRGVFRMDSIPGLHPRCRSPIRGRDAVVALGRPVFLLALCLACFAWTVCFPGRNRRHGNRGHGAMDSARSGS